MRYDSPDSRESKLHLFWSIYILDKALSLRLGRTSAMPDHDISLPHKPSTGHVPDPWISIFLRWIDVAKIQGEVYDRLFSPAALSEPARERASHAGRLASKMQQIIAESSKACFLTGFEFDEKSPFLYIIRKSDEVNNLAILTLIYRATPTSETWPFAFVAECVDSARAAMDSHHECMARLKLVSDTLKCSYAHWTVLQTPFVPFIVIFCHVIDASDFGDLRRLEDFVRSIECLCPLSQAVAKLHYLCQTLVLLAQLYIKAKVQGQEDQTLPFAGQEVGRYLASIGLAPHSPYKDCNSQQQMVDAETSTMGLPREGSDYDDSGAMSERMQLDTWFSGNLSLMALLEDDLVQLDPEIRTSW
ncbi:hypothetical protein Asppvi_009933 [Aspergillus pseudoviridinutans]|uniref:Xylanolytic transcriptional activator regulatory domain-containing protein n=1 Tax=Aspergillus pseudoviridinutans TaxID=1517512 RepID=A0A9P3EZG1_9EURO|nr:uncharacterized protein Asppvi_009933 [Aspergillus pseudoviridinutans]GIJ90968.1 hypothetical protein Asppvi_009933 [Aspergillus pseudoviridinutans]